MERSAWLSKENTVARPGFNRWLVPPAALAIHLSIGMAYGFSVFWLPLSKAIGVVAPVACSAEMSFIDKVFTTSCDWPISMLGWMFTLFFVFLGSSAAVLGSWVERSGPRKAGLAAALCWSGGLVISALGVLSHQIWLLWLGSGVLGGVGLGLGYISPVSTLIKWFPDRRGMATGMAIMGFGGGAMIGAPLANSLMTFFASPSGVGVWQTFLALAGIYFVFMIGGALAYRVPAADWKLAGWTPPVNKSKGMITARNVHVNQAVRTPQFWLIWGVLCLNVSAGIGLIGMASPLLQEVFGGRLLGLLTAFSELDLTQKAQIAAIAAGFTGLLSLFNIGGRFLWASLSDYIGRKATYTVFFMLGIALYASLPSVAAAGSLLLFVAFFCVIVSMYGGGFATIPAYLADMFGTKMVSAIHGRLLTAWSTAGVLGPVLVNYIREYQLGAGVPPAQAYNVTMYVLAGLLALGLMCNLLVRPVKERHYMTEETPAAPRGAPEISAEAKNEGGPKVRNGSSSLTVAAAWLAVGIPLAYGLWTTIKQTASLFR
ncbi:MAG: OFA family MFS transporter [Anaerolineales bacterium]